VPPLAPQAALLLRVGTSWPEPLVQVRERRPAATSLWLSNHRRSADSRREPVQIAGRSTRQAPVPWRPSQQTARREIGVDAEQNRARLDVLAFGIQALEQDSGHARSV